MTDHPITPPPELVQQWWEEADQYQDDPKTYFDHVATEAARWGADQQLTEDAKWLAHNSLNEPHLRITPAGKSLREAMRPKPLSLRELALESVKRFEASGEFFSDQMRELEFIRKALEQLDD